MLSTPTKEIMDKLNEVMDPELDRSLVELGFINDVKMEGTEVHISFRLPTYWCSPNFAYMMASDIYQKVSELSWVTRVTVELVDHSFASEINAGISNRKTFEETFPNLSGGNLEQLKRTFKIKAFYSRQEKLIRHLLNKSITETKLLSIRLIELEDILKDDLKGKMLKERYVCILKELGFYKDKQQLAFIDENGAHIEPNLFKDYLLKIRRTSLSMDFNSFYCQGLLFTRYDISSPGGS